jgi:hypothetical protein
MTAERLRVAAPDNLMVFFLGEITNSQLAINSGTVTQTMMKGLAESHQASTAQPSRQTEGDSPSGGSPSLSEPVWRTLPTEMVCEPNEELISAEALCRKELLLALGDLLSRLDQLGLDTDAQQAIRQAVAELQFELNRTPINMARVHSAITQIRARMGWEPRKPGHSPGLESGAGV